MNLLTRWIAVVSMAIFLMGAGKPPAVKVFVAEVVMKPYVDTIEALGTLQANEHVSLAATVTETVTAIHFEDNQRVKKGDLLIVLDSREEIAELAEEEATLAEAKRQLQRLEPLAAKGAASQASLDESRLAVETAQARIRAIESRINLRRIRAPFDGVTGLRNVSVGALVENDREITSIDDDSVMKLDFSVSSRYLMALRTGLAVSATSTAFGEKRFEGTISAIDSRVDPVTRAVTVRARIANLDRTLKPGLLMQVEVEANPRESLVIPEQCIIASGNENYVLVVVQRGKMTTVERRKVTIGTRSRGEVEILDGVVAHEQVISHGLMKAKPGKPIVITGVQTAESDLNSLLKDGKRTP